ncbi:MAG: phage virion morphogenesis protein, partial [Brevinema sp.]
MVEIDNSELKELVEKIEKIDITKSLTVAHAWGNWLVKSARARIKTTKKAPDGTKWASVSDQYETWLEKKGIGGSLLFRTGSL